MFTHRINVPMSWLDRESRPRGKSAAESTVRVNSFLPRAQRRIEL